MYRGMEKLNISRLAETESSVNVRFSDYGHGYVVVVNICSYVYFLDKNSMLYRT